ncbi:MKRN2 opposite strand protein isoform X1 [Pleurodeles waltl]|uniref:MKRN2 opposite strand protein isoform X1 n=1 Tax=Pleurodeles waltl TaxID=8319 RepID=UPI00370989E7
MHPAALEQGIIMLRHCEKDIYCASVPDSCPVCGQSAVASQRLEDAPVRIPSPFVNGHREKFSFLLKPTEGTFLRGYDGMSDLHVGITNSKGIVYNYNQAGVQREEWGWEQCVGVPLLQPDEYGLINLWDKYLEDFSTAETWLPHRYEEYQHNCYTYALAFVNCMLAAQGKRQKLSKNEFTEQFVLSRTRRASKYITIYQAILHDNFYIIDTPHSKQFYGYPNTTCSLLQ